MSQTKDRSLIHGSILKSLISFAIPVLLALLLQAMYGAADLIIVGSSRIPMNSPASPPAASFLI